MLQLACVDAIEAVKAARMIKFFIVLLQWLVSGTLLSLNMYMLYVVIVHHATGYVGIIWCYLEALFRCKNVAVRGDGKNRLSVRGKLLLLFRMYTVVIVMIVYFFKEINEKLYKFY